MELRLFGVDIKIREGISISRLPRVRLDRADRAEFYECTFCLGVKDDSNKADRKKNEYAFALPTRSSLSGCRKICLVHADVSFENPS